MIQWGLREVRASHASVFTVFNMRCGPSWRGAYLDIYIDGAGSCGIILWRPNSLCSPVGADYICHTGGHLWHCHGGAQHLASHGERPERLKLHYVNYHPRASDTPLLEFAN